MKRAGLLVLLILIYTSAHGSSLRCRGLLVKPGDSINVLLKKCGNPLRKYASKEVVKEGGRSYLTAVSNWVYSRKGKQDMIVSIRSGSVVKIQTS